MEVNIKQDLCISYEELLQQTLPSLNGIKHENKDSKFAKLDIFIPDSYGDLKKGKLEEYYVDIKDVGKHIAFRELSIDNDKSSVHKLIKNIISVREKYIFGEDINLDIYEMEVRKLYREFSIEDPLLEDKMVLSNDAIKMLNGVADANRYELVRTRTEYIINKGSYNIDLFLQVMPGGIKELENIDRPPGKHKIR